ncbi:TlpA disulfide reductase family protein [Aquimarina gracilis]|uniref:TlpA disulfide reductase family protein n=1 Tax=Aquimarina gracilis TaxID=874422 RepID=A0ABU5ZYW0_9FLAO|nr:TlpA disulfide reductase family protein [Aquimarina gracilis]MEB3347036.1 TlpA disulfide reductase family protein [Aquimarina gracilis]
MKKLIALLLIVLICFGCKKEYENSNRSNAPEYFDLSAIINKKLDSIQSISQLFINNPSSQQGHDKNDSITREIGSLTENIIHVLIESYGKTHTDTILTVLKKLDNSGYIPNELYKKLNEKDFSTEIGKRAAKEYQKYVKSKDEKINSLKNIKLIDKKLSLIRVFENDTIKLQNLLLKHKGYKVLDFWATWCAPCRSFNKRFHNQYKKYKNKGIEFYGIGIRVDSENEKDKFLTAVKNDRTPWKQFIDLDNEIYNLFETNTVPYQVLLDDNNQIVKILSHDIDKELDEILEKTNANTVHN